MERTKWVERKFTFDFPEGWIFNILERLRGTPARIAALTAGLSEETLCNKPNGKWSIKEEIGHLYDLESLHDGRVDDFIAGREHLRAADMANAQTNAANHNARSLEELLTLFAERREGMLKKLNGMEDAVHFRKALHPRLQVMMRPVDLAYFTAEHDDHHICSMRQLILH